VGVVEAAHHIPTKHKSRIAAVIHLCRNKNESDLVYLFVVTSKAVLKDEKNLFKKPFFSPL
jgi:hypothetical protein